MKNSGRRRCKGINKHAGFEVLTAVVMKSAIF
jgi:hypothetical protein